MRYLSQTEIDTWRPDPSPPAGQTSLDVARRAMADLGLDGPSQQMGRRWPVACVALEITQRCNLDCTACYLSEMSEAVHDLPLTEVFRRIERIHAHYGLDTDVQITGGDPTLRRRDELVAIVARVRSLGMRPTLMTNGIRASASLLRELAANGLMDVVFHVDTTQQRAGFTTEASLDTLRERHIASARAADLQIMFNTTIHDGNVHEVPHLVGFFRDHCDSIRTASFQPLADTGRGVMGERGPGITMDRMIELIQAGAGTTVRFDSSRIGHPSCSRYGLCLAHGGKLHDLLYAPRLVERLQQALVGVPMHRDRPLATVRGVALALARQPSALLAAARWLAGMVWRARASLPAIVRAPHRATTLSFTVHAFMDARRLEADRIHGCVFKVMTGRGPISMCLHNARRDDFILAPVAVDSGADAQFFDPLSGRLSVAVPISVADPDRLPRKRKRGRARRRAEVRAV